jgi:PadR family transcriptional regulator, regulatory protein AphA
VLDYVKLDILKLSKDPPEEGSGKMKTLEYVILAGLMRRPRSGYDLTKWMERETSHFFAVGHSSVYPALARLERDGLVEPEVVPSDKGPERKVYSVTEVGREALLSWADLPPAERQMRDEQLVKALCYPYMPEERALARLEEERARHEEKLARYGGFERELEDIFRGGGISREAYLGTRLTLSRGTGVERSYVEWCEEAARMISSPKRHAGEGPAA